MNDQYHALDQWELFGEECVEEYGNSCHRDDHEGRVPWFGGIVGIVQSDYSLELGSHQIRASGNVDLPA